MATAKNVNAFAPRPTGVRDPRDADKRNGMFMNWPRYQYLGGSGGAFTQAGTKRPRRMGVPGDAQNATAPISDRGRGR